MSIAAGKDHLLALTSSGRTFAHPIDKNANSHGQLGFRKFDIADPSSSTSLSRLHVELIPKSAVDPYANKARYNRQTRGNQWFEAVPPLTAEDGASSSASTPREVLLPVSENLMGVNDEPIRFCDKLFEVPSLKGVKIDQIAAGARSSYAKTDSGRVLGWGANEYGYVSTISFISYSSPILTWFPIVQTNWPRRHCHPRHCQYPHRSRPMAFDLRKHPDKMHRPQRWR